MAATIAFVWLVCAYLVFQANKDLADLTRLSAVLDSVKVIKSSHRAHSYLLALNLRQESERPGINFGQSQKAAEQLASLFHRGDTLVIYYDATGITSENINLHTFQIQSRQKVFYSLSESRHPNKIGAWISGTLALFFSLVWLLMLLYKKRVF